MKKMLPENQRETDSVEKDAAAHEPEGIAKAHPEFAALLDRAATTGDEAEASACCYTAAMPFMTCVLVALAIFFAMVGPLIWPKGEMETFQGGPGSGGAAETMLTL